MCVLLCANIRNLQEFRGTEQGERTDFVLNPFQNYFAEVLSYPGLGCSLVFRRKQVHLCNMTVYDRVFMNAERHGVVYRVMNKRSASAAAITVYIAGRSSSNCRMVM